MKNTNLSLECHCHPKKIATNNRIAAKIPSPKRSFSITIRKNEFQIYNYVVNMTNENKIENQCWENISKFHKFISQGQFLNKVGTQLFQRILIIVRKLSLFVASALLIRKKEPKIVWQILFTIMKLIAVLLINLINFRSITIMQS